MKRVTRAVRLEDVRDLLERPPRAHIAFAREGAAEAGPVAFRFEGGRYWIGLPQGLPEPAEGERVSLLVDEGRYHTELRGLRVTGVVGTAGEPPAGAADGLRWLEVLADNVMAWDYGAMRERAPVAG